MVQGSQQIKSNHRAIKRLPLRHPEPAKDLNPGSFGGKAASFQYRLGKRSDLD